jgi:hypothetical protein
VPLGNGRGYLRETVGNRMGNGRGYRRGVGEGILAKRQGVPTAKKPPKLPTKMKKI